MHKAGWLVRYRVLLMIGEVGLGSVAQLHVRVDPLKRVAATGCQAVRANVRGGRVDA